MNFVFFFSCPVTRRQVRVQRLNFKISIAYVKIWVVRINEYASWLVGARFNTS